MNQHGDHVATCLCCEHCTLEYSGESASLECTEAHFSVHDAHHELLYLARDCKDFKPKAMK